MWLGHSAPETQLLATSRQFADEALEALCSQHVFGFVGPADVKRFMKEFPFSRLGNVSEVELPFKGDVYLHFLQSYLAFKFMRHLPTIECYMDGYTITDFLEDASNNLSKKKEITITLRYPWVSRMWQCGSEGCCHFELCKWIVKAAVDAAGRSNREIDQGKRQGLQIKVVFKRAANGTAQRYSGR